MATFFGEVTEVPSRAVWWSDSEDEEEEQDVDIKNSANFNFAFDVQNKDLCSEFRSNAKLIFVTIGNKKEKQRKNLILKLKILSTKLKSEGNIAWLYQIDQNVYWIELNSKQLVSNICFDVVESTFKDILMPIKSSYSLILLSTSLGKTECLKYLMSPAGIDSHTNEYLSTLKQLNDVQPLIAPETLGNEFELALLEYCIINNRGIVCFVLPSNYDTLSFIPNDIKDGFNDSVSYNNIIT